jgi:hypothetical protein
MVFEYEHLPCSMLAFQSRKEYSLDADRGGGRLDEGREPAGLARWPGCQDRAVPDGGASRVKIRRGRRMPEAGVRVTEGGSIGLE